MYEFNTSIVDKLDEAESALQKALKELQWEKQMHSLHSVMLLLNMGKISLELLTVLSMFGLLYGRVYTLQVSRWGG